MSSAAELTTAELVALPAGSRIATPAGMTHAVKVANAFRNGVAGWLVNGSAEPISSTRLPLYGRGWRVSE